MTARLALTLITGDPAWASAAVEAGIDRVLVDLERLGKAERQAGRHLRLSSLQWDDVAAVRAALPAGTLMVRLDPLHDGTRAQVERALELGADRLMLPYFAGADEIFRFCDIVAGRVPVVPLIERLSAMRDAERLIAGGRVEEIHVGLNDLAIDCGLDSHIPLWTSSVVADLAAQAGRHGLRFGIGGVTDPRCDGLPVDPDWIIAQQVRLGSRSALLGRHFRAFVGAPDPSRLTASVEAIRARFRAHCSVEEPVGSGAA